MEANALRIIKLRAIYLKGSAGSFQGENELPKRRRNETMEGYEGSFSSMKMLLKRKMMMAIKTMMICSAHEGEEDDENEHEHDDDDVGKKSKKICRVFFCSCF